MFEHRSDLISDKELDSCYSWVSSILDRANGQVGHTEEHAMGVIEGEGIL